nr:efflux RND transporter permease subunit [Bacteroidales bacterium]
ADQSRITDLNEIPVWSMMNLHFSDEDIAGIMQNPHAMSKLSDKIFTAVPLSAVAKTVNVDWEEQVIHRVDSQRAIEAECDPNIDIYEASPAKVEAEIREKINQIQLPEGYSIRWVGEAELSGEAITNMMNYVPITLFLILGILLFLFESWKKVLLVLICFPFVICGIVPSLLAFSQPFTFMAIVGLMGLMGMMIKNSIVLIDEINRLEKEENLSSYDAVVTATVSRTRPVVMASLTTILGMLPLVGDAMYNSMAISIMSGLALGTVITLILLPVFYTVFFRIKK